MKPGDLVRVKEFYRINIKWDCFGVLTAIHEDDEGCLWYKIVPFDNPDINEHYWYEDFAVEVVSEI
jgi:hypothetical protein